MKQKFILKLFGIVAIFSTYFVASAEAHLLKPCDFYSQGDQKTYSAKCGVIKVPENREIKNYREITIPLTIVSALKKSKGAVFWFEGGPGSKNEILYPMDGILENYDLVMVGYRGMEGDSVLPMCSEISEVISSPEVYSALFSEESRKRLVAASSACANRLSVKQDLRGYTMNQTIEDIEQARKLLGYDKIILYGNSYGTRLQLLYQEKYPKNVLRNLMVAINPPGKFYWTPKSLDRIISSYSRECDRDKYCSQRVRSISYMTESGQTRSYKSLFHVMKRLSRNMPTDFGGVFPINADAVKFITAVALVESKLIPGQSFAEGDDAPLNAPSIIDMWLDAAEGDTSGMALATFGGSFLLPAIGERSHFLAMGSSTLDYHDPHYDYIGELLGERGILGAPFSLFNFTMLQGFPVSPDQAAMQLSKTKIPTLIINGQLDAITPPENAWEAKRLLGKKAKVVILKGVGHTESFWTQKDEERRYLIKSFIDHGKVRGHVYKRSKVDFYVNGLTDYSDAAKIIFGGGE